MTGERNMTRCRFLLTLFSLIALIANGAFAQPPAGGASPGPSRAGRAAAAPAPAVTTERRSTGDQQREYLFAPTGETMP